MTAGELRPRLLRESRHRAGGPCQQVQMSISRHVQEGDRCRPIAIAWLLSLLHVTVCCDRALRALHVNVASALVVLRGKSTSCHVKRSLLDSWRRGLPLA
jgi:hypothetical protein